MTKEEFLRKLESKLKILDDDEVKDIIEEYRDHIQNAIEDGKTEEEVIKSFGSVDDLAKDILSAYKVKNRSGLNDIEDGINNFVNKVIEFVKKTFSSYNSEENIVNFIIEVVIILFLLWLLRVPFSIIRSLGLGFIKYFSTPIYDILKFIWLLFIDATYLVTFIMIFVTAIRKRLVVITNEKDKEDTKEKEESKIEKINKKIVKEEPKKKYWLYIMVEWIAKFILFILLLPALSIVVALCIAIGFVICLMFKGIFLIGILLILIGLLILTGSFIDLFMTFIKGGNR